jgi:hypothetical protein
MVMKNKILSNLPTSTMETKVHHFNKKSILLGLIQSQIRSINIIFICNTQVLILLHQLPSKIICVNKVSLPKTCVYIFLHTCYTYPLFIY